MIKKNTFVPITCFIIALITFLVHLLFFSHSFPESNIDEASFFSPAYSLAEKGRLSTDIHNGFLSGASTYTYWMPPLYMTILGVIFMIVGPSVLAAKIVSLMYVVLAAIVLSYLVSDKLSKIWMASLLFICPFVILCSTFIRMEALAILIVSLTILVVKSEAKSPYLGILAALAFLTHPLLIACSAALAFIALRRGALSIVLFSLAFLIVISPYLYYISLDFELFKEQMTLQLIRKSEKKISLFSILYALQSLPLGIVAMWLLWKIKKYTELKYFLTIGMSLSLILIIKSGEFNYHVYVIPYVISIIGLYLNEHWTGVKERLIIPLGYYSFFVLLLIFKAYSNRIKTNKPYHELIEALESDRKWEGKTIYVSGIPDVAIHLIQNHQKVERQNAVASLKKKNWYLKYNYVVEVINHSYPKPPDKELPWLNWKAISSYPTSDGNYTLVTYSKE